MRGEYIHVQSGLIIPNTITAAGEAAFLRMIAQARVADVSSGGNFYIGLMEDNVTRELLSEISGEPSAAGGYARQAVIRSAVGWPTVGSTNGVGYIETDEVDFTASGADFSTAVRRLFLTNVLSGTVGILFSISSALSAALTIEDGDTETFKYRLWMR